MAAVGEGLVTAEERQPCRLHHHAEAEDRGFQATHPLAVDSCADATGGEDFCGVARNAGEGDRRHRLSPIGTGVSALRPGAQADDSDMLDRRSADAERAMDDLRKKFGNAAVIRGIAYEGPAKDEEEEE